MFKLYKEAFKTANDCIILAIPLVLFMWILSFYFAFSNAVVNEPAEIILAFITVLFMTAAFLSGWFYMVQNAIVVSRQVYVLDEDRAKATMNLFKVIPYGIGKYFLSFIGLILIFLFIVSLAGTLVYKFGIHYIGNVFTQDQITAALSSTEDMKLFIDSLTVEQLIKLNLWNFLIMGTTTLISFLIMFWIPEIIYSTINPFTALFKSLKKVFVKFPKSVALFIYLSILNIFVSFLSTFAILHPLLYLLVMVICFYFIIYVVVLVFSYYEKEFNGTDKNDEIKA